jgi:hypothetical protein
MRAPLAFRPRNVSWALKDAPEERGTAAAAPRAGADSAERPRRAAQLRNVAKFFAHLLATDAVSWEVLAAIRLTEDDTTSSSRIFIKILFQARAARARRARAPGRPP